MGGIGLLIYVVYFKYKKRQAYLKLRSSDENLTEIDCIKDVCKETKSKRKKDVRLRVVVDIEELGPLLL